ncbi:unnamed protein product [Ectocarpus sp. 6 AP-2014]
MVVAEVADRMDVNSGTPAGKAAACTAFQDLIKACSWSSFVVRSPSFTAEGLRTLQKSQIDQVKQVTRVMGVALGSIHKGLHIARNVVVNGERSDELQRRRGEEHAAESIGSFGEWTRQCRTHVAYYERQLSYASASGLRRVDGLGLDWKEVGNPNVHGWRSLSGHPPGRIRSPAARARSVRHGVGGTAMGLCGVGTKPCRNEGTSSGSRWS